MVFHDAKESSAKADNFRTVLRMHALETGSEVKAVLLRLLEGDYISGKESTNGSTQSIVSRDKFGEVMNSVRTIRQKFTPNDLNDIYAEATLE